MSGPGHHKTTVGMFLRNSLAICHTRQSLLAKSNLLPDAFDRAPVAARCLGRGAQCPVVGVSGHGGSIAEWSRASPAQLDTPQGQHIVNKAVSGTEALVAQEKFTHRNDFTPQSRRGSVERREGP